MRESRSSTPPSVTPRAAMMRTCAAAGLALLVAGAAACGEAEREAGEPAPEERPAATDTVEEGMPAETSPEEATTEAEEPGDDAAGGETEAGDTAGEDDVREAGEDTVPRMNPPEGRNWILVVFHDSVTEDDLAWLDEHGFHVDTVTGTTVRGWLGEDADRAALAEAEGGDRIESFEALMRGPGR